MKLVIQRCNHAAVHVDGQCVGAIQRGAVILLAVAADDTKAEADHLAGKVSRLRIYDDPQGKLNATIQDVGGDFLVVSQFTLYGDCRKGNRPSYIQSAPPEQARALYEYFVQQLRALGHRVETGRFQEMMKVSLENDGPVTLILEKSAVKADP